MDEAVLYSCVVFEDVALFVSRATWRRKQPGRGAWRIDSDSGSSSHSARERSLLRTGSTDLHSPISLSKCCCVENIFLVNIL